MDNLIDEMFDDDGDDDGDDDDVMMTALTARVQK